jgi:SAM-dependent methyltransferase
MADAPADYRGIFERRGRDHDLAFRRYPQACQEEVQAILRLAAPLPGETLLDVPAAGGFLSTHLEVPGVRLIAVDPSPVLHALCRRLVPESYLAPANALPLPTGSVDVTVCLAGLHHDPDPGAAFKEIRRVLRPHGRLAIAEVAAGSAVAGFLNGFVDRHNSLGHQGHFLDDAMAATLVASGFAITGDAVAAYHWRFASRSDMADCLRLMFGIDLATPGEIVQAVESELGVDDLPGGAIGMRWSLRHLLARPLHA